MKIILILGNEIPLLRDTIELINLVSSNELNIILDNLPFGITVQTKDRVIIYENKFAIDLLGRGIGNQCYRRWSYLENQGDRPCIECPGHISLEDGNDHGLIRNLVSKKGEQFLIEVIHHPLLNKDGIFDRFIEIMKPVNAEQIFHSSISENEDSEYQISIMRFGTLGGEIIVSDDINFLSKKDDLFGFTTRIAAFWFAAVGQGHQWPKALFGPLPVLDYSNYHSFGFSTKLKLSELSEKNTKDSDLVIVIIFTQRQNDLISQNRHNTQIFLEKLFTSYYTIEKIDENLIKKIKTQLEQLTIKNI